MPEQQITLAVPEVSRNLDAATLGLTWELDASVEWTLLLIGGAPGAVRFGTTGWSNGHGLIQTIPLERAAGNATVDLRVDTSVVAGAPVLSAIALSGCQPVARVRVSLQTGPAKVVPMPVVTRAAAATPLDATLIACRHTVGSDESSHLVLVPAHPVNDQRFTYLGAMRYRRTPDATGPGRALTEMLDDYGARSWQQTHRSYLDRLGAELWRMLPEPFRFGFDRVRRVSAETAIPTMLIATDDLVFPWELVTPLTPAAFGEIVPEPPLGIWAALARWGLDAPPPADVAIGRVASWSSALTGAGGNGSLEELALVADYASALGLGSAYEEIVSPLDSAGFAALAGDGGALVHVRTHGRPDGLRLSADEVLTGAELATLVAGGAPLPAFLFVNACAPSAPPPSSLDGGPSLADVLVRGGSGAVLPAWTINYGRTVEITALFYAALAAGTPPAEAIRAIRADAFASAVAEMGTTPLAYAVFGHPGARVVAGNEQ